MPSAVVIWHFERSSRSPAPGEQVFATGSRTGTTGVAGATRLARSAPWPSNCNTH